MLSEVLERSLKALDRALGGLQKYSTPAILGYEELGGLSDPGSRDCAHRINMRKIPYTHKKRRNRTPTRTLL